ncbi:unnamed protein product [Echinostoma caproni]|uniref:DH domain-containing protein n=1 Tax=Echinostoma caproni TaxID=27848 RepID=A0A183ALD7_9TREM|nr:unnamed protein product [Echinostoma caproni]
MAYVLLSHHQRLCKDPSSLANLLTSLVSKRDLAIRELILTEESYANDLNEVKKVFYEPMRNSMLLSDVQINRIFLNWSELSVQSRELLNLFTARVEAWNNQLNATDFCVGDILVQHLPKFRTYRSYCTRQTLAAESLHTYLKENVKLQQLVRLCEQNTRTRGLPLSTYLLKPMQRLTKYRLLVERILEHTDQSHPDFDACTKARLLISNVLDSVNTAVGTKALDRRTDWLRARVIGDAVTLDWLTNSGKRNPSDRLHLLFYGTLFKVKSGRELIGFLFTRYLLLTSPNFSTGGQCFEFPSPGSESTQTFAVYKQPIPLAEIIASSGTGNDYGGKLYNSLSNLTLPSPSVAYRQSERPNPPATPVKKLGSSSRNLSDAVHEINLTFSLFRRSKPGEPFLTLRAPSSSERYDPKIIEALNLSPDVRGDQPQLFHIILWTTIGLILTVWGVSWGIWNMDPGHDGIIYRGAAVRPKRD